MRTISPALSANPPRLRITAVETFVLLDPGYDPTLSSSAQDGLIVLIHTDGGVTGIGETDANPWMVKAAIEAPGTHTMGLGIRETLIGADPLQIGALWEKLYIGTAMNGRRGIVVHALGAIEMALWDLTGKALGQPVHALLPGGAQRTQVTPYASLQPLGRSFGEYRDALVASAERAKALGFRAMKAECTMAGPYAHDGMAESYDRHTEVLASVRAAVGPEVTFMADIQYMFETADECLAVIQDWAEFNLFFLETPIWSDNLAEYAKLAERAPMKIALGEWAATRWEFAEIMDAGRVQVVQPDVGRVGGLGEARIVCDMAAERGRTVVPHCWKTGIGISATAHLAFTVPHCAFIEYLPADLAVESLRRELARESLTLEDGLLQLPTTPGLGLTLDMDAVRRFTVA